MRFAALHRIRADRCEFDWRARTGPLGLIHIRDALVGDEGMLTAKALGVFTLARAGGTDDAARGELMRYLAELPWTPDALLSNPELRWDILTPERFVVSAGHAPRAASVELSLNEGGLIERIFAPDRPRAAGGGFVATPWAGRFADYREFEGALIPARGEVGWVVDRKMEIAWEGRVDRWRRL